MKYLSPLLLVVLFTSCIQSEDATPATTYPPPDTARTNAVNAVIEMSKQASIDNYNASVQERNKNNVWRYDVPMPGNTYRNTVSASLKAYDVNAYLKLVNGKDVNMAILLVEESRFYANQSQLQEIQVKFDSDSATIYTCSVDPLFGFLIIQEREQFIQRLKQSHKIEIEAVTREMVQRTEYSKSSSRRPARTYSYLFSSRSSRRRSNRRNTNTTTEITRTQMENSKRILQFNSSGLVWDH